MATAQKHLTAWVVWFRKPGRAWACECPTMDAQEADDHMTQAKALGCEVVKRAVYLQPPDDKP